MKRPIAVALLAIFAASLVAPRALSATAAAKPMKYDDFGFALLRHLSSQTRTENVFISPVSIGVAMSMAADGARDSTREAILRGLGVPSQDLSDENAALIAALNANHDANLGIANAIWLRKDIPPARAYVDTIAHKYGATAQALHFGDPSAAETINAWTKAHTLGLIDRLVDRTNPYDFAFLTNALAFNGKWTTPFKKNATHLAPFTDAGGSTRKVQMMNNTAGYDELDGSDFRAVRLPYGKGGFAAYIVLPNDGNADTLAGRLAARAFDDIVTGMRSERLALSVPRFTATYRASLKPVLETLGMGVAFSPDAADFSAMHPMPPRLYIAAVQHASYVRVDEEGTVAAAATSVEIGLTSVIITPAKPFIVDRPFVFAIRDERVGALLFLGVIRSVNAP
jgi:serine protease inhibitor